MSFWHKNIALLVLVTTLCSLPAAQTSQQFLTISPPEWDFKTIKDDKMIGHTFIIKNHSKRPVALETLPSSCGCMIARPEPPVVPAGGESKIPRLVSAQGPKRCCSLAGQIEDRSPATTSVGIASDRLMFIRDAFLSEDIVNFNVFKRGTRPKIILRMACRQYPQFKLQKAEFDGHKGFDIKFGEGQVDGLYPGRQRGYHIEITPNADIAYGRIAW